ncbi:inositol transport system permease protein [Ruminiclostridium sufflavum DSM 19573]|uniref:Inositol transport system permease protein n=1 Tax=Ruminiclostridium sufflavum DSM 19573 TaxID=1121337 RepID=A0A318XZ22_9FIRM|nr:ABC transporter permease [Ruminiclostridium sufflavum]PYG88170.1 inositol transport system permease protein [Ruminiclostridium sufflavum DSM 19573]
MKSDEKAAATKISVIETIIKKYGIYLVLLVMIIISAIISPNFFDSKNLLNIARQISVTTIIAFGQTLLIICGMIDLSSGSVVALSGVLGVSVYMATGSLLFAILVGILIGAVTGIISGFFVTKYKMPPFIVTMAMQLVARGAVYLYTGGQPIYQIGDFKKLGQGSIGFMPIPVFFMILVAVCSWVILNRMRLGRYLYAIGGNEDASRASGIHVGSVKILAFVISGVFAGVAGVLLMGRLNAGLPQAGINYEFDAITAAIIGGTSFTGGIGTAAGTLVGAFIMGILNNILNLMNVQSYVQQILKGVIIVAAVAIDISTKTRKSKPVKM